VTDQHGGGGAKTSWIDCGKEQSDRLRLSFHPRKRRFWKGHLMAKVSINGMSYDPLVQAPALAALGMLDDSASSNYILIQTTHPLTARDRIALAETGAQLLEYLPSDTYICLYPPPDLAPVKALPFVKDVSVYPRAVKVAPTLTSAAKGTRIEPLAARVQATMSQEPRTVDIVLHRGADMSAARAKIAAAARVDADNVSVAGSKLRLRVQPQLIDRVARVDEVRHIEEYRPPKLHNTVALRLIGADRTHADTSLQGAGQLIAVCDTGFDLGSSDDVHPAFTGRVRRLIALGRATASDPNGHGTHVAGSVLGDGVSPSMGSVRGAAPRASLMVQSVLDSQGGLGGLPDDLDELFHAAYADGARVHTNSWGSTAEGAYTSHSFEVDQFVWNHRDMVVLFSAGNAGVDDDGNGVIDGGSLDSPATAKNCITVGASESDRREISKRYGDAWPDAYPAEPIASDLWADEPNGLAAFSSRGPTRDGRIKPDVVAPGTAILSAQSRRARINGFWGTSDDRQYCFMGGTSMATPIVAGCAAIVREFFGQRELVNPSAALVKAMLINGARVLAGQYSMLDNSPIPNYAQGFGRVDISATVGPRPARVTVEWYDEGDELDTGDTWHCTTAIDEPGTALRVTLVWTDPPGEALQNDLDLVVRAADATERHGNMAPDSAAFDRHNNVEQVEWVNVPIGPVEVMVIAHRIALDPQSFAIVVRRTRPTGA
jgi:serine protease AprX